MIYVDLRSRMPIYEQLYENIRMLILNGDLETDAKLPSVRELAGELAINPNTIQKAFKQLEQDGYIYVIRGRGNFVNKRDGLMKKREQKVIYDKCNELIREAKVVGLTKDRLLRLIELVFEEETR